MAWLTAARGWLGWKINAALLFLGVFWAWPVAFVLGLNHYTIDVALFMSVWSFGTLTAGLLWGLVVRRLSAGALAIAAALFPSVAGAAYLLERQRVPEARCAVEATFRVGELALDVPRALGASSRQGTDAPDQAWSGRYGIHTSAKPDVRRLCRMTENGETALEVTHLWLSARIQSDKLKTQCAGDPAGAADRRLCAAFERARPAVYQFYARPDGRPVPSLGQFRSSRVEDARSAGEIDGFRCNEGTNRTGERYCTFWHQLTPDTLAVASGRLVPFEVGEAPLDDAIVLIRDFVELLETD